MDLSSISIVKGFLLSINLKHYATLDTSEDFRIDLRAFGKQLGWYIDYSLGIGINAIFGAWYSFRAVLLVDT